MTVEDAADLLVWDFSYTFVELNSVLEKQNIPCVLNKKKACLFVYASDDDKRLECPAFEIYVCRECPSLKIRSSEKCPMSLHEIFLWETASIHTKGLIINIMLKDLLNKS